MKTATIRPRHELDQRPTRRRPRLAQFPEINALGSPKSDFSAVIFDFDGTLGDSMWVWERIDDLFCEHHGLVLPDTYYDDLATLSFEQTARFFQEDLGVDMTFDEIADEFNRLAHESYATEVACKPGAKEYLERLKERGVGIGIATSLSWHLLEAALESNGIAEYFDDIAFCDESCGKGEPDVYLLAAERLGARPQECLVFEDIVVGVASAKVAGMAVGAVIDPHCQQDSDLIRQVADFHIESFEDLLA